MTPPEIGTFLLTSKQDTGSIIDQQRRCQVNTIQLCDNLVEGSYTDFRKAFPGIKIVDAVDIPVWLAGGLNPDNVSGAIEKVSPFGLDVCTGVRSGDLLDEKKLKEFMANSS